MNRRVEKLIPKAIKAAKHCIAENEEIVKKYNGAVPSEYNGYISAFGAAVLQSGLKAAIAFNESASSKSAKNRRLLMLAILEIISGQNIQENSNETLLDYVLSRDTAGTKAETKAEIMDAATALKLAIRTFELKKEDEL